MKKNNEFKENLVKNKSKLIDELKVEFNNLCVCIQKFSPYQILSHLNSYFKMSLLGIETEYDLVGEDVELKYTLELVQMILGGIRKESFKNEIMNEEDLNQILSCGSKIHSLKLQYILAYTYEMYDSQDELAEYIFESEINSDITGKRYDIFEVQHYRELFMPLKEYFEAQYNFSVDELCMGIDKLKRKFMFGIIEVGNEFEKLEKIDEKNIRERDKENFKVIFDKLFGLKLQNVGEITGWPKEFLDILTLESAETACFLKEITFEKLYDLHKTITKKPLIKIGNDYYYLSIQRLLDNLDRIILRDLYKNMEIKENVKKSVAMTTEELVGNYIKNIIPSANVLTTNFYKIEKNMYENDVLITFDKFLFIIEVKSGSFSQDVALNNVESHLISLKELIENADSQVNRFENALIEKKAVSIFDSNNKKANKKQDIKLDEYEEIFKMVITLEGFNEIEARADKVGILNLNKDVIVCSIDDLKVYSDYFENNPTQFLHYMMCRKEATRTNGIELNDELDHLGLYIRYNCYPVTTQNLLNKKRNIKYIWWEAPREELDKYYTGKYIGGDRIVKKPSQEIPERLFEIIQFVNENLNFENVSIISNILDLDKEQRNILFENIEIFINRYINTKKIKYAFIHNRYNNLIFISCVVNDKFDETMVYDDIYANMKITESSEGNILFLYYDENKKLINITYKYLSNKDERYSTEEIDEIAEIIKEKRFQIIQDKKRKIGRNDKCPCGSGKKYKKCCEKYKK